MKSISIKDYEEFLKYTSDRLNGRILTPDGLRFIIEAKLLTLSKELQEYLFLKNYNLTVS